MITPGYAIVLPGRKSAFLAGLWPDCYRETGQKPNTNYNFGYLFYAKVSKLSSAARYVSCGDEARRLAEELPARVRLLRYVAALWLG